MNKFIHTFILTVFLFISSANGATFIVDDGGDDDDDNPGDATCATAGAVCTLRAAIQEANALSGADAIEYDIATATRFVVTVLSTGLTITETVSIDATTQFGTNCGSYPLDDPYFQVMPSIALVHADPSVTAIFKIQAEDVTIKGFVIAGGNETFGFDIEADGATIQCNRVEAIGFGISTDDVNDTLIEGNVVAFCPGNAIILNGTGGGTGNIIRNNEVFASGTSIVTYGQTDVLIDRNWVHDNLPQSGVGNGINIPDCTGGTVQRNFTGTDRSGYLSQSNTNGIHLSNSSNILIGHPTDPAYGNIASGNDEAGVSIEAGCTDIEVANNKIGYAPDGVALNCNGGTQLDDQGTATNEHDNLICIPPTPTPAPGCCDVTSPPGFTCIDKATSGTQFTSLAECQDLLDSFFGPGNATADYFSGSFVCDPSTLNGACFQNTPTVTPTPTITPTPTPCFPGCCHCGSTQNGHVPIGEYTCGSCPDATTTPVFDPNCCLPGTCPVNGVPCAG